MSPEINMAPNRTSIGGNRNDCRVEAQGAGDHEGEAADENVKKKEPKKDPHLAGDKPQGARMSLLEDSL